MALCFDLVSSRHLRTAAEAATLLLEPLLPFLDSHTQTAKATSAVVDLLKHCVEVGGGGGEGVSGWLLSEQSGADLAAIDAPNAHAPPPLALLPDTCSDISSSDSVAVVACKVLHALLRSEQYSSGAAKVVIGEMGLAALVALLEGVGATVSAESPALPDPFDALSTSSPAPAVGAQLSELATSCLFDVMDLCAAEGAVAQV